MEIEKNIDLICGDCLEELKNIPGGSIDLVIIDPPYEFDQDGGGGAFGAKNKKYHNELSNAHITKGFNKDILNELKRVMKKVNLYVFCNKNQIKDYLDFFDGMNFDLLSWHKTNPVPTCNNKYLSDTEYILFFRENGVKVYGSYQTKHKYYISATNKKDKLLYKHPTIKPLEIINNLVINSSLENDTVLDCFLGSGTTGVVCKQLKRKFIGIEINKNYFEIAKNRISNTQVNN